MSVDPVNKQCINKKNGQHSHVALVASAPNTFSGSTDVKSAKGEDGLVYGHKVVHWDATRLRIRLVGSNTIAKLDNPPPPDGTVTITLTNVNGAAGDVPVPVPCTYVNDTGA
jgi:hypothetical protein